MNNLLVKEIKTGVIFSVDILGFQNTIIPYDHILANQTILTDLSDLSDLYANDDNKRQTISTDKVQIEKEI